MEHSTKPIHAFLMAGQSNMAGRGMVGDVSPIREQELFLQINGRWYPLFEPANADRPFSGTGLAPAFARRVHAEAPQACVGLIPCAEGGSYLDEWRKGDALYDNAVLRTQLAQRTSAVQAILWHQGESDAKETLWPSYEQRFLTMMEGLRADLGLTDVPVLLGGLGDYLCDCPDRDCAAHYMHINAVLRKIAAQRRDYYFVDAKGLTSNPDLLHFNALSLREFGLRYAYAYLNRCDYQVDTLGFACKDARIVDAIAQLGELALAVRRETLSLQAFMQQKRALLEPILGSI